MEKRNGSLPLWQHIMFHSGGSAMRVKACGCREPTMRAFSAKQNSVLQYFMFGVGGPAMCDPACGNKEPATRPFPAKQASALREGSQYS